MSNLSQRLSQVNLLRISTFELVKLIRSEHPDAPLSLIVATARALKEAFEQGVIRGRALAPVDKL